MYNILDSLVVLTVSPQQDQIRLNRKRDCCIVAHKRWHETNSTSDVNCSRTYHYHMGEHHFH